MSVTIQEHLRESVLRTALYHLLKNCEKSPERSARNIKELLVKFRPEAISGQLDYEELLSLIRTFSREECLDQIMRHLS